MKRSVWALVCVAPMCAACSNDGPSAATGSAMDAGTSARASDAGTAKDSTATVTATSTGTGGSGGTLGTVLIQTASDDYTWSASDATYLRLAGSTITVEGAGATVEGAVATITAGGTYVATGSLSDGRIIVSAQGNGTVRLVLAGADITCATSSPIYVAQAKKTLLILADGTVNRLQDGASYQFADATDPEPDATVFSRDYLGVGGDGTLIVVASYGDAIAGKDELSIAGGTIAITAKDDGIRGKDYLLVKGATLTIDSGGDGIKATNQDDLALGLAATLGYIAVSGGALTIRSGGDAITAATHLLISGGTFNLTSGGGSSKTVAADTSAKGLKAGVKIDIGAGTFTINSADDAVHANDTVTISGGTLAIASGDDGIHADATLTIADGTIDVSKSYEGFESATMTIRGGKLHIVASDDGINVAGGADSSSTSARPTGAPSSFASSSNHLYVEGGTLVVVAAGDGIDVNGGWDMTGGTVIVHGPIANDNGALDYDSGFKMSGGLLVAAGSSGMAMAPDASSTQYALLVGFSAAQPAGSLVHLQTSSGEELLTFAPSKTYQSLAFSSPVLTAGKVAVYLGGTSTGTVQDGLYAGGTYSPGTLTTTLDISSIVTTSGTSGTGGPGGAGPGGMPGGSGGPP